MPPPVRTVCRTCGQPFAGAACPHCGTVPPTITPSVADRSLVEPQVLAPPRRPDEIGRLGPYRVLSLIGEGGMGRVYRAEDPALQREVAIKLMLPQQAANPLAKKRFVREARAQAKVEHDHVVPIFQVAEVNGVPFLAMPLLKGMSLAQALSGGGRPPVTEACRIAREVAEGLGAAHEHGLIHRDIKPGNIWLEGTRRRVKILDFGLARVAAEADTEVEQPEPHEPVADHLTRTGALIGTPAYMSPEQARGEPVDPRADLFSLGVVLYQMLAGRRPFDGPVAQVLAALAAVTPPPPSTYAPEVPAALDALVMRLLAKKPADRPATAERLVEELRQLELGLSSSDAIRAVPLGFAPQTAPAADPWATLDSMPVSAPPTPRQSLTSPHPPLRRKSAGLVWVAAGFLVVVLATVAVVLLMPKSKKATPTVPDPPPSRGIDKPKPPPPKQAKVEQVGWKEAAVFRPGGPALCVAASADGKRIAAGTPTGELVVWDTTTDTEIARYTGHSGRVLAVAFHPNGTVVASGGDDKKIRLTNLTNTPPLVLGPVEEATWAIAFSSDGTRLAACGSRSVWDPNTGAVAATLPEPTGNGVAFAGRSHVFVEADFRGTAVRTWNGDKGQALKTEYPPTAFVRDLAVSPNSRLLAVAVGFGNNNAPAVPGTEYSVKVFDRQTRKELFALPHSHIPFAVAFTGKRLASVSLDGVAKVWDYETGKEVASLTGHDGAVWGIDGMPGGRVVTAGQDGTVRVWQPPPAEVPAVPPPDLEPVVAFVHRVGMGEEALDQWMTRMPAGYYPVWVGSRAGVATPTFDGVAVAVAGIAPVPEFRLKTTTFEAHYPAWDEQQKAGFRYRADCLFTRPDGSIGEKMLWVKDNRGWAGSWHAGPAFILGKVADIRTAWPISLVEYDHANGPKMNVIMSPPGLGGPAEVDVRSDEAGLAKAVADGRKKGLRPVTVTAVQNLVPPRYTTAFAPGPDDGSWDFSTGLSLTELTAAMIDRRNRRMWPSALVSAEDKGQVRFTVLWAAMGE